MKRKILAIIALSLLTTAVVFAGGAQEISMDKTGTLNVGLVLTTSGLGDNNFNDMAYKGLVMAGDELGITYDYGEPATVSDYEMQQRSFAATGDYDLILVIGADQVESLKTVAADFPDQMFTVIDGSLDMPNIHSIFTRFEDQTFLTGVLAGLMTSRGDFPMINGDQKKIGIITGMDIPILRTAIAGYMAGAKYVDSEVEVLVGNVGSFNDPGKGKEIAMSMYGKGADFIQLMAGGSGLGIINAAVASDAYAFGVGANQNAIQPDYVVATAIRNVHSILFNDIKNFLEGTWTPGLNVWGIKESAVGYSSENSNVKLPEDVLSSLEEIRLKLVAGEIVPPKNIEDVDSWAKTNNF